MNSDLSSLNYITLLFGIIRLLIAFYAFFLVGIKGHRTVRLPFQGFQRAFLFFLGLWELTRALVFLYPGTELLPRFMSFIYIAVPFTSLTYFYFCFTYTFPKRIYLMKYLAWLALIPTITVFFALVPEYNKYFIIFTDSIIYVPYRETSVIYGPWFYVHSVYSYALVLAGIICLIIKIKYPSTQNRKFCVYAIIATALFILQNAYRTFFKTDKAIWFIPILSIAVLTLFFLIIYADEAQVIVNKGQEKLMKTLLFPIFFLDKDTKIVHANQEALKVCPNILQNSTITGDMQNIMENFSPYQFDTQLIQNEFLSEGSNILLQSKIDGSLYYLHEQNLITKKINFQNEQVKMLTLITVSAMQNFFSAMEERAFRDPLCGCYNRHYLEVKQAEMSFSNESTNKLLPINFIMCDIDGLKIVNDTYGHDIGNEYILLCHDILKSTIRKDDLIFRLGGDEFLIILPNTEKKVVGTIVSTIELKMQQVKKDYNTSISIGVSTAEKVPIDYTHLFKVADEQMYKKKINRKNQVK